MTFVSLFCLFVCLFGRLFIRSSLEEAMLHIVVCSVPWPLNRSEAEGDLFLANLLELFFTCNNHVHGLVRMRIKHYLHMKSRNVCIKPRSFPTHVFSKAKALGIKVHKTVNSLLKKIAEKIELTLRKVLGSVDI